MQKIGDEMKRFTVIAAAVLMLIGMAGCAAPFVSQRERLLTEGRYVEAEKAIKEDAAGKKAPENGDLIELCLVYSKLKNYEKLFSVINRLEENIKAGKRNYGRTVVIAFAVPGVSSANADVAPLPHIFRAEAYLELGDFAEALMHANKAHQIVTGLIKAPTDFSRVLMEGIMPRRISLNSYRLHTLGLLGVAHALAGNDASALAYLNELDNESVSVVAGAPLNKQKVLSVNKVCMALGQYDRILENKLKFFDSMSGLGYAVAGFDLYLHIDLPRKFVVAKALMEKGRLREAKSAYDELLANKLTKENGEIYWAILFDRGRIARQESGASASIDYFKKAVDVIESQRSTIHSEAARIGFVGDKQSVYHQLIAALYDARRAIDAFEYAERSKSRALVDLLASKREFGQRYSEAASILNEMHNIEGGEQLAAAGDRSDNAAKFMTRSIEIKRKLVEKAPELATLVTVNPIPARDIQAKLGCDETLIEYYYKDADLYAFVVTRGNLTAVKLSGEGLEQDADNLRKSLESASGGFDFFSGKLYRRLIAPLEPCLKTSRVSVVSHGILHYIPFGALQQDGKYLIDRFALRFLPSAGVITFLRRPEGPQKNKMIIFGNPDLGDPGQDLKHAQEEAAAIAALYPHSKLFLRGDASKGHFLAEAGNYDYVHLAAHGAFRADAPLHSGVFLAGGKGAAGFVSVNDLFALDLKADLVTLSACETGLGKVRSGDDVVGFVRGFLFAGANSILASLWKVDDLATSDLMIEFYRNLKRHEKDEALRLAQMKVRKKYRHPFYWASFQLIGGSSSGVAR